MSGSKEKKHFADLSDEDFKIFMDHTGISLRQAKEIFADLQKTYPDGKLNREDFSAFYKKVDPDKCKLDCYTVFTDKMFNAFNTNNDGHLSVKEILLGFAICTKGEMEKKLNYVFALYDTDNNGFLTKEEVKDGFKGMFIMTGVDPNEFVCDVCASNKIQKLDKSKDGIVTKGKGENDKYFFNAIYFNCFFFRGIRSRNH